VISRLLVIALAFGAAVVKAMQGAWVEAVGLAGLGAGLAALRFVDNRSIARPIAWACFLVTALAIGIVLIRQLSS
jgi:hypothetical protein